MVLFVFIGKSICVNIKFNVLVVFVQQKFCYVCVDVGVQIVQVEIVEKKVSIKDVFELEFQGKVVFVCVDLNVFFNDVCEIIDDI